MLPFCLFSRQIPKEITVQFLGRTPPETPDAAIAELALKVGRTPEFLENTYYFQQRGQAWVQSISESEHVEIKQEPEFALDQAAPSKPISLRQLHNTRWSDKLKRHTPAKQNGTRSFKPHQ